MPGVSESLWIGYVRRGRSLVLFTSYEVMVESARLSWPGCVVSLHLRTVEVHQEGVLRMVARALVDTRTLSRAARIQPLSS